MARVISKSFDISAAFLLLLALSVTSTRAAEPSAAPATAPDASSSFAQSPSVFGSRAPFFASAPSAPSFAAAQPTQSAGSSSLAGLVPEQCSTAALAFATCLPALASAIGGGGTSGGGNGIPGLPSPSATCCSSLQTIDPTCFCTLLSQARKFFGSGSRGTGAAASSDQTALLTSAAYKLPSLCGLQAIFMPSG